MRRGHSGRGGWRSDHPRHSGPRGGGSSGFRPHGGYRQLTLDYTRFPPPNHPRFPFRGGPPFRPRTNPQFDRPNSNYQDQNRNHFHNQSHINRNKGPDNFPSCPENDYNDRFIQNSGSFQNEMGDVDFRQNHMRDVDQRQFVNDNVFGQNYIPPKQSDYTSHKLSWSRDGPRQYGQGGIELPAEVHPEYAGHRPPASDHYLGQSGPATENSETFSRSVGDTVDIIKKKLISRNDPQSHIPSGSQDMNQMDNTAAIHHGNHTNQLHTVQKETTPKKRIQRTKQNLKANCDQVKNQIVHQLFKMDRDKIHKLMDNPHSSTKFEYAINSLVTESQNSYNRHLRTVAEKSLGAQRSDIIPYNTENDTIYEDTFMKQMQCILDPQDTVFLEDMKPIVMAELNRVLQIDNPEYNPSFEDTSNHYREENSHQDMSYGSETDNFDYINKQLYDDLPNTEANYFATYENPYTPVTNEMSQVMDRNKRNSHERRPISRTGSENSRMDSSNRRCLSRESFEKTKSISPKPYFNVAHDHFSDDDDPFAELDNQYHVAVDRSFIENDDLGMPPTQITPLQNTNPLTGPQHSPKNITKEPHKNIEQQQNKIKVKHENIQIFQNPKCKPKVDNLILNAIESKIKTELLDYSKETTENCPNTVSTQEITTKAPNNIKVKEEKSLPEKQEDKKSESTCVEKSSVHSNSRKRSTEQRPSHRKEKRKKSGSPTDTNNQILNKNIIINVNDCAAKTSEKCDVSTKSVFNLYFSKNKSNNDQKESKTSNDTHIEKHTKRKESPPKPKDVKKKSGSNHSNVGKNCIDESSSKENKKKLQPIDMFLEQPKKPHPTHQAHRNTTTTTPTKPAIIEDKVKTVPPKTISKLITRKHVGTQVIKRMVSKQCQTICNKEKNVNTQSTQTEEINAVKDVIRSSDPIERMKEIDLEIQKLLQEKFKIYNSIGTKDSNTNSMETLGMTVLNVTQVDEKESEDFVDLTADKIIDDFTNIPEDELAQIALESVESDLSCTTYKKKKNGTKVYTNPKSKKSKTPNISLLEEILKDDTPLEDIISLDDLETQPKKNSKSKKGKGKKKKIPKLKIKLKSPNYNAMYDIKPCSVVLMKEDLSKYCYNQHTFEIEDSVNVPPNQNKESNVNSIVIKEEEIFEDQKEVIVVEPLIEEFHFQDDMLDVCEDIVVDSNCEFRIDGKEESVSMHDEVVLDNSQSSEDPVNVANVQEGELCKMYDYSADEDLRHETISVTGHSDSVIAIEFIENNFLAACVDGNVYYFNNNGQLLTTLRGSNLAVTCLTVLKEKHGTTVYTGCLDSRIRYYDLETGLQKGPECNVLSPIQSMDRAWDTVFVGTRTGYVLQFECKNNLLIPVSTIKFSEHSIMAIRALKEGPRKVLLVGSRSDNVTIKDAQTGLLLRSLVGPTMTVYALLYEDGKVFCGTSSNHIQVFDYASGSHIGSHEGGKGVVCVRAAGGLLFAGCYDGAVYVFRSGVRPVAVLRGPASLLLSLAVHHNKVIVGYKDRSLYIWKIPENISKDMVL